MMAIWLKKHWKICPLADDLDEAINTLRRKLAPKGSLDDVPSLHYYLKMYNNVLLLVEWILWSEGLSSHKFTTTISQRQSLHGIFWRRVFAILFTISKVLEIKIFSILKELYEQIPESSVRPLPTTEEKGNQNTTL